MSNSNPKPNIVLILADDLGFADLGCTGSEIKTPHLDQLAEDGMLMTQMYNCARCCPTRASLLTGLYPHQAGIGHMGADLGTPAYQGFLRSDAGTMAEHLRAGGYRTLMSGKWHVTRDCDAMDVPSWRIGQPEYPTPRQRGFDRFYGILDGVSHFFSPHCILRDDERISDIPDDFYFTDAITQEAIGMIDDTPLDQPYFLYLAHTAPHWPLHALPQDIARYEGVYRKGWDAIRTARHEEMCARDLFEVNWEISARDRAVHRWQDEPEPEWQAAKMAVYAAMVDRMDQQIGRLVAHLRARGDFENTLILFLSDNGGCAEFMAEDGWAKFFPDRTHDGRKIEMGNRPEISPGDAQSYQSYDKPWANVSNAPFREFKHYVHEGGISTPLIAHWPKGIAAQSNAHEPAHVVDLLPTLLEVAGLKPLGELGDCALQPLEGTSLLPLWSGQSWEREAPIFFEHEGNAAVRIGQFKLVRKFACDWELYNLETDRTELCDLIAGEPARATECIAAYTRWADRVGVMDWSLGQARLLAAWGLDNIEG